MTELVLGLCSERHVQHGISGSVREHVPAHAEARLCKSTFEELSWGRTSPPKPCSLQVQPRQSSRMAAGCGAGEVQQCLGRLDFP